MGTDFALRMLNCTLCLYCCHFILIVRMNVQFAAVREVNMDRTGRFIGDYLFYFTLFILGKFCEFDLFALLSGQFAILALDCSLKLG